MAASNCASCRCVADGPSFTRPKVASRKMRRQPRSGSSAAGVGAGPAAPSAEGSCGGATAGAAACRGGAAGRGGTGGGAGRGGRWGGTADRCGGADGRGGGAGGTGGRPGRDCCWGGAGGRGGAGLETSGGATVGEAGAAVWGSLGRGPGGRAAGAPAWSGRRRSRRNSSRAFMGSSVAGDPSLRTWRAAASTHVMSTDARPPTPDQYQSSIGHVPPRDPPESRANFVGTYCARLRHPLSTVASASGGVAAMRGRDHSKLPRLVVTPSGRLGSMPGWENKGREQHVGDVVDGPPQRIYAAASWRLNLTKLACQAGIVISFYDLSKPAPGHRSALHGRIPNPIISAWGTAYRQGRRGLSPQPPGAAPAEAARNCSEERSGEGSGAYDAQARRVI
jgi:hypothetical protein